MENRNIELTNEAVVNLAMINYRFGSREALLLDNITDVML